MAWAPNCVAEKPDNTPPKLPMGVRTADTINTSFIKRFKLCCKVTGNNLRMRDRFFTDIYTPTMKKFFILLSNYHEEIFKYVIILGSVVLIVAALPYDTQFNFEIRKSKHWPYEPPIAATDSASYKSESELSQETIDATTYGHAVLVIDTTSAAD